MSITLRSVRRAIARGHGQAPEELPVPEGHVRRNKGVTTLFFRAGDTSSVIKRLAAELGEPGFSVADGHVCCFVRWPGHRVEVALPGPGLGLCCVEVY